MCVAIIVESEITKATLEACDDANPHGAGVAWAEGDQIAYRKGLGVADVARLAARLPRPFLLHFRWATHGPTTPYLTHPFPLGERALVSRATAGEADAVLIHNGVWSDYRRWIPEGVDEHRWSDTAVAAYVAGTLGEEILDHVAWSTAVARAAGAGRMDITLRGRWMAHTDGNTYSNLHWVPRPMPARWRPVEPTSQRALPLGFVATPKAPSTSAKAPSPPAKASARKVDPWAGYTEPYRSVMRALAAQNDTRRK